MAYIIGSFPIVLLVPLSFLLEKKKLFYMPGDHGFQENFLAQEKNCINVSWKETEKLRIGVCHKNMVPFWSMGQEGTSAKTFWK